ncbi:MAG: CHASE2 domain-containing protein [Flammeovirgaceae bacterium]|nr:CHASE2 domain-containing protein [Flammeovirgaceae bacterium]
MKKFWFDALLNTIFVFAVMIGLYGVSQLNIFSAFDPLGKALGDMELSDIAFSQLRNDPAIDTNIVIVNIGELSRGGIGQQIMTLAQFKPKVIGLDIIFSCDWLQDSLNCPQAYDVFDNMVFSTAVSMAPNMVMAEKIWQTDSLVSALGDTDVYDSIEHTYPTLLQSAYEGFVNLETNAEHQEDIKACRRFNPSLTVNDEKHYAFGVKMAMIYDSVKTKKFLERGNASEIINYRGNIVDWFGASTYPGRYPVLDWEQALDTSQFVHGMIKDKIIIMGYLGRDLRDTSWDDKFFTPLNKIYAGRARPDMYGVVVHANITSMILTEDYVNEIKLWHQIVIAFFVVLLNIALFKVINRKIPIWYDGLSLLIQVAQVLIFSLLMVQFFNWWSFKFNITFTLLAVALVGTCFELYNSLMKTLFTYINELITKRRNAVLSTESDQSIE